MNDSPRYLVYAENLAGGIYFDPLNFWYISYVFFVAFVKLFSASHLSIIVAQYILGFVGVLALFSATTRLTNSLKTGFLAAMIFILFPDNLMWSSYVLTESFYCTIICIALYYLVRVLHAPSKLNYFMLVVMLVICFFSKPTSPALFIAIASPIVLRFLIDPAYRVFKITGVIMTGIIFLTLANTMISEHAVLLIYEKGDVVFAMHEVPNHPDYDLLSIEVPADLYLPSQDDPLLVQVGSFIFKNPWFYAKLFINKIFWYVTHIRPFWSLFHNVSIATVLWTCYFFCALAIRKKLIDRSIIFSAITYFCIHTFLIGNTWVDWDGRFFVPLVPVIVIFASIGISDAFNIKSDYLRN